MTSRMTGDLSSTPAARTMLLRVAVAGAIAVSSLGNAMASGDPTLPRAHPDFDLRSDGVVCCLVRQPDGRIIVAGSFSQADRDAADGLARMNVDGSVDTTWAPRLAAPVTAMTESPAGDLYVASWASYPPVRRIPLGGDGSADEIFLLGGGPHDVYAMAVDDSGHLYAETDEGLHRYDAMTGQRDEAWHAAVDDGPLALDHAGHLYVGAFRILLSDGSVDPDWAPPQLQDDPAAIALGNDGYLYLGGAAGPGIGTLARLSVDSHGAIDATWQPLVQRDGSEVSIDAILPLEDGSVVIGGLFDRIGGRTLGNLARLTGARGQADPRWTAVADGEVFSLASGTGTLYVGGRVRTIGAHGVPGIARLFTSGDRDAAFAGGVYDQGLVLAIAVDAAHARTYVGGRFDWAGDTERHDVLRLAPDGTLDAAWSPAVDASYSTTSGADHVDAIAVSGASDVYLGGLFTGVNGLPRNNLARLDAHGATDPAWHPDPQGGGNAATDGRIHALVLDRSGYLMVGGDFTRIGGLAQEMIARVAPTGVVDAAWRPDPVYPVSAFAYDGDDNLFFTFFDERGSRWTAGKVSIADGTFDFPWDLVASAHDIAAIAWANGWLYANDNAPELQRLSPATGAADPDWHVALESPAQRIAVDADGRRLYVAGLRDAADASGQQQAYVARVDVAAGIDPSFAPAWEWTLAPDRVEALAVGSGGVVYAGGRFDAVSGVARGGLAAFDGPDDPFLRIQAALNDFAEGRHPSRQPLK